jgi:hypothetical protein
MAITSIGIQQDNRASGANLLAIHNPVIFIANVNFTGQAPDTCNVELYDVDRNLIDIYSAIPYRDTLLTQRQFVFKSSTIIKSLMDDFDDVAQLSDVLVYVEGLTKQFYIRFSSPDDPLIYAEVLIDFAHAQRQFGETVCMSDQYNNDEDTYYAPKDKPCYVYFYNDDVNNILSTIPVTFTRVEFDQNPLFFGYVEVGNNIEKSVVINGYDITGDVVINAPTGYQVSLTSGSGFGSSVTIPFTGATFTDTLYFLFTPTLEAAYINQIVPLVDGHPVGNTLSLRGTAKLKTEILTTLADDWVCPEGVTEINVECYGAGGIGADNLGVNYEGGGGAGGQYAAIYNYPVVPGRDYPVRTGYYLNTSTRFSSFSDNFSINDYEVYANGGADAVIYLNQGAQGSVSGAIGTVVYAGGNGGDATPGSNEGGGGGGAGGPDGNGGNASGQNFGIGNGGNAGNGGYGGDLLNPPVVGAIYGGGGGGNGNGTYPTEYKGASGGVGAVVITYADYDL